MSPSCPNWHLSANVWLLPWMYGWDGGRMDVWPRGWMCVCMGERVDGWMYGQGGGCVDVWVTGWTDGCMGERVDGWMYGQGGGCVDVWVRGWTDGCMDKGVDRWIYGVDVWMYGWWGGGYVHWNVLHYCLIKFITTLRHLRQLSSDNSDCYSDTFADQTFNWGCLLAFECGAVIARTQRHKDRQIHSQ